MIEVAVIILNWNRAEDTIECLRSLNRIKTKGLELNVLVVDNGSDKEGVEKIKSAKDLLKNIDFEIVENKKNLGFAAGNNVGMRMALNKGAKYILILNNDTLIDREMVLELVKTAQDGDCVGAVSPKIYFAPGFEFHKDRYSKRNFGKVIWYAGGKFDKNNCYGSNRGVDEVDTGQFDKSIETDFTTGACTLFNTQALKEIGLYDEAYYMYLEDLELSFRLKKFGFKSVYSPKSVLWHKVSQSSAIGGDLNDYFITRNRMLFGLKYLSIKTKFALIRESIRLILFGREWQKRGILDYYLGNFGRGSWPERSAEN